MLTDRTFPNVAPGNRRFRDLINMHRRAYLKARKNDKPAISRAIVRAVRVTGGKFLRRNEKEGLWYEVGDDAAREKTSQALRQRAPEMRRLMFHTERREVTAAAAAAAAAAEEQSRPDARLWMGATPCGMGGPSGMMLGGPATPVTTGSMNIMNSTLVAATNTLQRSSSASGTAGVTESMGGTPGRVDPCFFHAMIQNMNQRYGADPGGPNTGGS
jgi:hypothetical protein